MFAVLLAIFDQWLIFQYFQQSTFNRHQSISEWCRCMEFVVQQNADTSITCWVEVQDVKMLTRVAFCCCGCISFYSFSISFSFCEFVFLNLYWVLCICSIFVQLSSGPYTVIPLPLVPVFELCSTRDRKYKSREVAQSQIYVIVHSVFELSFCTQPFPIPSGGLW